MAGMHRIAVPLAETAIGAAGTETVEIKSDDPISRITIIAEIKDKTNRPSGHPWETISRIEVVDGSKAIYELNGRFANALDYYDARRAPVQRLTYVDDFYPVIVCHLWFGRELWDEELALDPRAFDNPQLKITWDADAVFTGATDVDLTVLADVFHNRSAAPKGYLRAWEVKSYTPINDSYEYIDLPVNYPIRKILAGSYEAAQYAYTVLDGYRLNVDQGKWEPFDLDGRQVERHVADLFPPYQERIRDQMQTTSSRTYITPAAQVAGGHWSEEADEVVYFPADEHVGGTVTVTSETNTNKTWLFVSGYLPHGVVCFPMGKQHSIEDWLDTAPINSLELRLLGGATATGAQTARVAVEQLVRY